jgi:hypothetical protein
VVRVVAFLVHPFVTLPTCLPIPVQRSPWPRAQPQAGHPAQAAPTGQVPRPAALAMQSAGTSAGRSTTFVERSADSVRAMSSPLNTCATHRLPKRAQQEVARSWCAFRALVVRALRRLAP